MSLHEYRISRELDAMNPPFYALLMAAMRRADDVNSEKLKFAFQEVWEELHLRYNAPGGLLKGEVSNDRG